MQFDMKVDEEIDDMFFFKDKTKQIETFKKKNYIYITKDKSKDPIHIKGLPIIKSNASEISKVILEKLKPIIINTHKIKFDKSYLYRLIVDEIKNNIEILAVEFSVKEPKLYKNPSQLQCQIAEKYGAGKHKMIRNLYTGVGLDKKYCTLEEAKNLKLHHFDLETVWNELDPFVKEETTQSNLKGWFG